VTAYRVGRNDEFETELEGVAEWADAFSAARIERDAWICGASEAGYSLREIAEAAGLSHGGVKKIIERG
jgi:hypothetical protein